MRREVVERKPRRRSGDASTTRGQVATAIQGLAPRLRPVLDRLLRGQSEKQISAALRLSPHTVHQYVKLLYKRLGVHSRAQLMAKWVRPSGASQEMGSNAPADTKTT